MIRIVIKILVPLLILGAGGAGTKYLLDQKKPAKNRVGKKQKNILVHTLKIKRQNHRVYVKAQGTTKAFQELSITAEVGGKVEWVNPELIEGGHVELGDLLFRVDQTDYQLLVDKAKASLATAEFDLDLVMAQNRAAKEEQEILRSVQSNQFLPKVKQNLSGLALYEPQLKKAMSGLKTVRISLKQTVLNLQRTKTYAPIDGYIRSVAIAPGQNISAKQTVATMFTDRPILVIVSLPLSELSWFQNEKNALKNGGPEVVISKRINNKEHIWKGFVKRRLQEVDTLGRLVKVVVHVPEPKSNFGFTLPLGLFVEVSIKGKLIKNVFSIPHTALHKDSTLWYLTPKNRLAIKKVTVERKNNRSYLIKSEAPKGSRIVLSSLSTPMAGMKLQDYSNGLKSTRKSKSKTSSSRTAGRQQKRVLKNEVSDKMEKQGDFLKEGRKSLRAGDLKRSKVWYKKAIENNPDDGRAYFGLGRVFQKEGNHDRSGKLFKRACKQGFKQACSKS